ncbi:PH domain-containing protein, partial [Nesterenkonia alkaliphila]
MNAEETGAGAESAEAPEEENQPSEAEGWFDETWTKVHPLSPLVRGWVTIVAIPVAFFGYNWQMWTDLWGAWRSGELAENLQANPTPYLIGGGAFLALALLIFVGFTLSWWFTRYKVTEEHVMVKSGIFVRQHRQARIDRVQAVDLRQPLLARIAKLAELRFEVAEGDGTAATLAFLRKHEAEQLRAEIMDRAAGRPAQHPPEHDATAPAPDAAPASGPAPAS